MNNPHNITKGQEIWLYLRADRDGDRSGYFKATVSEVGRKYFTIKGEGFNSKHYLSDLRQVLEYHSYLIIFPTEEARLLHELRHKCRARLSAILRRDRRLKLADSKSLMILADFLSSYEKLNKQ